MEQNTIMHALRTKSLYAFKCMGIDYYLCLFVSFAIRSNRNGFYITFFSLNVRLLILIGGVQKPKGFCCNELEIDLDHGGVVIVERGLNLWSLLKNKIYSEN